MFLALALHAVLALLACICNHNVLGCRGQKFAAVGSDFGRLHHSHKVPLCGTSHDFAILERCLLLAQFLLTTLTGADCGSTMCDGVTQEASHSKQSVSNTENSTIPIQLADIDTPGKSMYPTVFSAASAATIKNAITFIVTNECSVIKTGESAVRVSYTNVYVEVEH